MIYPVTLDAPGQLYVLWHPNQHKVIATFDDFNFNLTWMDRPRILSVAGVLWKDIPADGRGAIDMSLANDQIGGRWVRIRDDLTIDNFEVVSL